MNLKRINIEKKQIDLIEESICVFTRCTEYRMLFKEGKLRFASVEDFVDDRGKSCLFRLKEMCHELFRNSDDATYREKLYDITVGYIFHEAMKLRENLYQLEYYKPRYDVSSNELTTKEKKIVQEIEILIRKAERRLRESFKEIKILINELAEQLQDLIKLYKNNYLLPRFILENEKSLNAVYGRKGFYKLIEELYQNGKAALIYRAAKSYLESEHYDVALRLFRKVLQLDRGNLVATFFYLYTSAFYFYYKSKFTKALEFVDKASSLKVNGEVEVYKEALRELTENLLKEIRKKRET